MCLVHVRLGYTVTQDVEVGGQVRAVGHYHLDKLHVGTSCHESLQVPVGNERPVAGDRCKVGETNLTPVGDAKTVLHTKQQVEGQLEVAPIGIRLAVVEQHMVDNAEVVRTPVVDREVIVHALLHLPGVAAWDPHRADVVPKVSLSRRILEPGPLQTNGVDHREIH